jgi:hypothetical protein
MKKSLLNFCKVRILLIPMALLTLLSLSIPSSAALTNELEPTAQRSSPEEILQQKRTWRAEKSQDLARLGDQCRSILNSFNDVLNPKIITSGKQRRAAIKWVQTINENIFKIVEKLRTKKIPTNTILKESSVALSCYVDILYSGLMKQLHQDCISVSNVDQEVINKKLQEISVQLANQLTKRLDAERPTLSPDQQKMLPEKVTPEMVDLVMIEQFVVSIAKGLEHLADLVHDYGITTTNRAARVIDNLARKVLYNAYMPYVTVPAFFAGVGLMSYLFWNMRSPHYTQGGMLMELVHGSMATALSTLGGSLFLAAWAPTRGHITEIKNRFAIWWKKFQGLPVKEKINGFEILKPQDCEGEEEPLIGLETPFARVMDSIQSALNRIQIGEREPLKGIQRTFVFIAEAGMGKTYLMEQLKLRIAQLQQFGMPIAYENIQGEQLVLGDLMARVKEAQQKNMGLVLWIDEIHLYKPMKDGYTPLLAQLLQTEAINKSNTPIWIFTATNEYGRFDKALIRSGRFEVIHIYPPTFQDRVRLFDYYLRQQGMVLSTADLKFFAAQTQTASPATIRKVINSARASGKALTKQLIQEKILQLVYKVVPGFELLRGQEQREIAVYQSGKLLVHVLNALEYSKDAHKQFFTGERFALVTASGVEKDMIALPSLVLESVEHNPNFAKGARRSFGHMFVYTGREDLDGTAMRAHEKELMISELLAGLCAQELCLKDSVDEMKKDDCKVAFEYCLDIKRNGVPLNLMSKEDAQTCRKQALELYIAAKNRTTTLLKEHMKICKAMINFMLQVKEHPHITALDVLMLMEEKATVAKQPETEQAQEGVVKETAQQETPSKSTTSATLTA